MLFFSRSAICIGAVALAAGGSGLGSSLERGGREAAASLGRACAASSECLNAGATVVTAALAPGGDAPAPHLAPPHGLKLRPGAPAGGARR